MPRMIRRNAAMLVADAPEVPVSLDPVAPRSRRALLGAALGAGAATIASAFGRPAPAEATNGGSIILGTSPSGTTGTGTNQATTTTKVYTTDGDGFSAESGGSGINGIVGRVSNPVGANYGVWGLAASSAGVGVRGESADGIGVQGWSSTNDGAYGTSGTGNGVHGLSTSGTGVSGQTAAAGGPYAGVHGSSSANSGAVAGVWGNAASPTGIGVYGETTDTGSSENYGVVGVSRSSLGRAVFGANQSIVGGTGVWGQTSAGAGAGVRGYAWDDGTATGAFGTGVIGSSGSHAFPPPAALANTGVYGISTKDATSRGVVGVASSGVGIHGWVGGGAIAAAVAQTGVYGRCDIGTSSRGVSGYSTAGTGMWGTTGTGTGLYGAASATTGMALHTSGRLKLDKVSGVSSIAAGATSVAVNPGVDVTTAMYVLLTPQSDPGSRRVWATLDATANTLTVHTSATSVAAFKVAWLLVG